MKEERIEQAVKKVAYVLDKSGSMSTCRLQAVLGTNAFLKSLRDEDHHMRVTVTMFNTAAEVIAADIPVAEIPDMPESQYIPNGGTALYDAVGQTILSMEESNNESDIFLVAIFTDGEENSSFRFTQSDVFKMINERQQTGRWTFLFLGADQDSWVNAEKMGIYAGNTINQDKASLAENMRKAGRLSARYMTTRETTAPAVTECFFAEKKDIGEIDEESEDFEKVWLEDKNKSHDS